MRNQNQVQNNKSNKEPRTLSLVGVDSIFSYNAIAAAVLYALKGRSCGWRKLQALLEGQEITFDVPVLVNRATLSLCYTKNGEELLNVPKEDFTPGKGEKWAVDGSYFHLFRFSSYTFDLKDEVDQGRFNEAFQHIVKLIREKTIEDFGIKKLRDNGIDPEDPDSEEETTGGKKKRYSKEKLFTIPDETIERLMANLDCEVEAADEQMSDEVVGEFFRLVRAMLKKWGMPSGDRDVIAFILGRRNFNGEVIERVTKTLYPPRPKNEKGKNGKQIDPEKKSKGNPANSDSENDSSSPAGGATEDNFVIKAPQPKPQPKPEPVIPVKRLMSLITGYGKVIPDSVIALVGVKEKVTFSEANEFLEEAGIGDRLKPKSEA